MNSVSNNAHASMRYTTYPDIYRKRGTCVIAAFGTCAAIVFFVAAVSLFKLNYHFDAVAFSVLTILTVYSFSAFTVRGGKMHFTKMCFEEECISCSRFGKPLKKLKWDEIKDIVCVVYSLPKANVYYLMFSGHELTEEEKRKSIELAGVKNDIVVVKCTKKNLKRIREIHDFSYVDESGRKNVLKEFFDNLRS